MCNAHLLTVLRAFLSALQLRFIIGQCAVQKPLALAIQGDGMMRSFAYVDTDEDFNTEASAT